MENSNIDYTKFKLSKDDILWELRNRCLKEMYAKAQPSVDYDCILDYYKKCKESGKKSEKMYERYYLSHEEFVYILEKYLNLFNLINPFRDHCDIIIQDMKEGCVKDKYIHEYTDENNNWHPGYGSYEKVPRLSDIIGEDAANKVIEFIEGRKKFYRFDKDESKFRFNVSLTDSPTSNMESVIKYWESQGKNLQIDPRHKTSDYFWSEENGYLDEEE